MKKILPQQSILSYQIDLYFPKHKLALQVDERGHTEMKEKKVKEKKILKKNLDVNFLELLLMRKIMIFLFESVKYRITLMNQLRI